MSDYYGYNKTGNNVGVLTSPTAVIIKIGGNSLSVCQSFNLSYQRTVTPSYEFGSSTVYMSMGPSSGTVSFERIVGKDAILAPYKPSSPCSDTTIQITGGGTGVCSGGLGSLLIEGAVLQNVGASSQAGGTTVNDMAAYMFSSLSAG